MTIKKSIYALVAVFTAVFMTACSEPDVPTRTIKVIINAEAPNVADPKGTLHVYTFNAWRGEGNLRHPLAPLEEYLEFDYDGSPIEHSFEYELNSGRGFAVYAWLDTDGDGALCTPTKRDEFSGLTKADEFPADVVEVTVEMSSPCAGPDRFFPVPK